MEIEYTSYSSLTLDQRVIALYESGITCAARIHDKVSRTEEVSLRTIERKVSLLKQSLPLTPCTRKTRSDKFLTPTTQMEIEEFLEERPFATASDIVVELNYNITTRTMQKALKEMKYNYLAVQKSPFITENQKENRIIFAEENIERSWDDVIFVDECSFQTHSSPQMAYHKEGSERLSNMIPKHPAKLHVFGGISERGQTDLFIFEENLDGAFYVEILQDTLLPSTRRLFGRDTWYLCQDDDPKHVSKLVKDCYCRRKINLVGNWPSASPDLNPIENIWSLMKAYVGRRLPVTINELRLSIQDAWDDIPLETIQKTIRSLPTRLRSVIEKNGEKIDY